MGSKYFCIGFNKTGTTSVEKSLRSFGLSLGDQATSEMLVFDWAKGEFDRILRFCEMADAFQDIPFSLPGTYKHLYKQYPEAKFILTVRDSSEQWFDSLVRFHAKIFSSNKKHIPTEDDLNNSLYRYKGYSLDVIKILYNYPEISLYDKLSYIDKYEQHIVDVLDFFQDKPESLLVINVSEEDAYNKLADFVGVNVDKRMSFPWENRT